MINFLISLVLFAASVFLLAVSIRYGLRGAWQLDAYLSNKNNSTYPGFQWYYRIPFSVGAIPEYFYAMVIGHDGFYRRNWWALKTASFISVLLFIAGMKSRYDVYDYFSLSLIKENGISALFTSGNFVMFLNLIVLMYLVLFTLICIESIKMHGIYAPIRIIVYSILSILMGNFTIITLSIIVFITIAYLIIKIIGFFFFSSKKKKEDKEEDEESTGSILSGGFREFKKELYEWETEGKTKTHQEYRSEKTKRRRPKISRRKTHVQQDNDIPNLHPDR